MQGGLQSIEESVSKGVPMVGIPFLADQTKNVLKLQKWEMALGIDPAGLTSQNLKESIIEVVTNKK